MKGGITISSKKKSDKSSDSKKQTVTVNINCCENKKENGVPSAFRAATTTSQNIGPADISQVEFQDEIFDLNNEYNTNTSTFIPKQDGVYSILASIGFFPNVFTNYSLRAFIVVNDDFVAADNDFFGEELQIINLLTVSTIIQLTAGDRVQVFAQATTDGTTSLDPFFTYFAAARYPSPV